MLKICGVSLEQGPGNLCSGGTRGNGWIAGEEEASGFLGSIGFTRAAGKREW